MRWRSEYRRFRILAIRAPPMFLRARRGSKFPMTFPSLGAFPNFAPVFPNPQISKKSSKFIKKHKVIISQSWLRNESFYLGWIRKFGTSGYSSFLDLKIPKNLTMIQKFLTLIYYLIFNLKIF